ncbi:DUF3466 family protein [Aliiglaciecola sp. LCG003]|uniref:DUF3466 family protein n=1 Tax=Aliiglaciecola sp. LCG003 TaxID=3053655 RepID=UPI00257417FE|nr:DUF3466 family protein [Aliiglaciecola sp. LCG003]WJG07645.1 DUF3466 family protein [Aliiglaciecola sp. LCG003]
MRISRLAYGLTLSILTVATAQAAKYRVVELPLRDQGVYSFASAINDKGEVAATIRTPFNPPIDVDLLNFESEVLINTLTDLGAAAVGNINREDLVILYSFITNSSNSANPFFQQLASVQSFISNNAEAELLKAFDVIEPDLEGLTKSADTTVHGINNFSATVGTAEYPFRKVEYRNENGNNLVYHYQEFLPHGFLDINGQTFSVPPTEDFMGGVSEAFDINDSFEVAGAGSIEVVDSFEELTDQCEDPDLRGDVPYEACIRSIFDSYLNTIASNSQSNVRPVDKVFRRRGMIWRFDSSGQLLSSRELGILINPQPGNEKFYASTAKAINNNGIAAGVSDTYYQDSENIVVQQAAVFDGEEAFGFIDDQIYIQSQASDINDNDLVVGQAQIIINGAVRTKFFVHDYQGEFTNFPDDFFNTSSSVARAINNNNLVVGEGEVDTSLTGVRRREAFLYSVDEDTFTNINTLLSCDTPYTIVQANDINDNDEISATAVIYREVNDVTGQLALDERGNTIFENVTVAVKLVPIPSGTIDDCRLITEPVKRKGGSNGLFIFGLLLVGLHRVFKR